MYNSACPSLPFSTIFVQHLVHLHAPPSPLYRCYTHLLRSTLCYYICVLVLVSCCSLLMYKRFCVLSLISIPLLFSKIPRLLQPDPPILEALRLTSDSSTSTRAISISILSRDFNVLAPTRSWHPELVILLSTIRPRLPTRNDILAIAYSHIRSRTPARRYLWVCQCSTSDPSGRSRYNSRAKPQRYSGGAVWFTYQ